MATGRVVQRRRLLTDRPEDAYEWSAPRSPIRDEWAEAPLVEYPWSQAPGGWTGPGRSWAGIRTWRTRHGEAEILWVSGEPQQARGVLLGDGKRRDLRSITNSRGKFSYFRPEEDRWQHGRLEIKPEDVQFRDGEFLRFSLPPRSELPDLYADMSHSPDFLQALRQDDVIAVCCVAEISNRCFAKEGTNVFVGFATRDAYHMIVHMRGRGEDYATFMRFDERKFNRTTDPVIRFSEEEEDEARRFIRDEIGRLGWEEREPASNAPLFGRRVVDNGRSPEYDRFRPRSMFG